MTFAKEMSPEELQTEVEGRRWYHVLDLPGGVTTPGWFDVRATVDKVPLPASLAGRRCLDVGTWDGFWAFEMERRGAAEVTAVDIQDQDRWDWPPEMRVTGKVSRGLEKVEDFRAGNTAFDVAAAALGSRVQRRDLSIYELSPDTLGGTFDFVFLGSLLLHLRDPVGALAAMRSVVGDEAIIADTVDAIPSYLRPRTPTARLEGRGRPWWWQPNRAALLQMIQSAGFEILESTGVYFLPLGSGHPKATMSQLVRRAVRSPHGREELIMNLRGIPHVAARVRPLRATA
jgi:tRNA (mo5U34)-methyltransferase